MSALGDSIYGGFEQYIWGPGTWVAATGGDPTARPPAVVDTGSGTCDRNSIPGRLGLCELEGALGAAAPLIGLGFAVVAVGGLAVTAVTVVVLLDQSGVGPALQGAGKGLGRTLARAGR